MGPPLLLKGEIMNWSKLDLGGKIIVVAGILATVSMGMSWIDVGFASRSGLNQHAYLLLIPWIYPVIRTLKNEKMNKITAFIMLLISLGLTGWYISSKTIELFGSSGNVSAAGAHLFAVVCLVALSGVIKYSNDTKSEWEKSSSFHRIVIILSLVFAVVTIIVAIVSQIHYFEEMDELKRDFGEELEVIISEYDSPPNMWSDNIWELRAIRNKLKDLNKPFWISGEAQEELEEGMFLIVSGLELLLVDSRDPESLEKVNDGAEHLQRYNELRDL